MVQRVADLVDLLKSRCVVMPVTFDSISAAILYESWVCETLPEEGSVIVKACSKRVKRV